jgi:hypothetical protein
LAVAIQNKGWSASEPVTVQVTCTDAYVTVSGGTWSAGSLDRRAAATNLFTATVAADCPKGHPVRFTVTVTQGDWVKSEERVVIVGSQGLCDPSEAYQYVLITSRAIRDATTTPNVRDLIAHRQAKGMTATIVAIEDILGAEYYKGVDDPETLRNFIRDAYNTWKTDFVLLGGDTTIIPMRKLYCSQVKDGNVFGWEHLPSDLYFQCLDGNYNLSNDSAWGEPTDGGGGQDIDLMAEVYLGRASVENATEMANFVYKTLLYETQSAGESYLRNHLLAGQFLGSGFGETNTIFVYGASYMTVAGHSTNAGGYATLSFDSCPLFNATTMYQYDDDLAGRPRWSGGDMIAKMNSGQFSIINHMGHGQYDTALKIGKGSVGGLSNPKPFFVFAEDCYSGGFDQDCIAERLISDNRSGAYAVVMNSRYGFGSYNTNWVNFDGPTLRIHRYFWNSYFGKNKVCLGAMIADGHEDSIWLLNREMARWCIYDTVFFGDPATPMRGRAEEATIAYDSATTDDTEGNGDGVINPGELVKLWVTLSNVGIKRTTGVEATLTCTDSYVTVTDNYAVYGEMPGMESKKQASYVIAISPSCPTPYEVTFNLNISDTTGGVWAASFKKTVYTSRRISGIVTEALGGTPLAGATVEYTGPRSGMVQTDAGGRYSILMTDGKATLVAKYQQPYFDSDPVTVTVPPDASGVNFAMGYADIDVAPTSIVVTASMGETPTLNLTIRNVGARNLTWSILDEGGAVISTNAPRQTAGNVTRELTNDARAAIAFDGNVLWENHPPYLYKLDPMTGALLGKLNVCAATPSARQLTWDGDNLWIKGPRNYSPKCYDVYAVNPETGNPVKTLRIYPSAEVGGVAAGEGFLWMMENTTPRKMLKVDSATGLVKGSWTIPAAVDANPKGIAYCNGAIWVVANGKVFKLNPADGSVISSFQGPANYIEYLAKNGPNQMWMVSFNNKKTLLVDLGETLWLKEDLTSGTVAGGGSQTITLTLDTVAAKVGTYEAEIHVRSNDPSKKELLVPVKFTVTASGTTNQPPTASAQSVSTAEDTPLVITLTGSDPEGSALTCTVVSSPAHGTLTGTGASRTYTPVANYNGSDSFTFKVNDGALDSAPATVSIAVTTGAVAPDAPTGLTATTVATNQINLAWADNATNEVGYVVNRSLDSTNWTFVTLTAVNATNYSNTGLTTNTLYYYRVAASNAGGLSAYCFASARTWSVYEAWRQRQFGGTSLTNSAISGATADPDRDGLNNEQEFWAGTSPTNAASCLALYSLTNNPAAPSEYLVRWQSVSDRWYTVQAATNLLTGFNLNLRTNIPGTPPVNVHTDSVSGVGSRFYRVKVE